MITRNMTKDQINKVFDKQIKEDEKYKIHKKLFNLTCDFTIEDWICIRTEKYWKTIDKLPYDQKKEYTLTCVEYYIKHLKKTI